MIMTELLLNDKKQIFLSLQSGLCIFNPHIYIYSSRKIVENELLFLPMKAEEFERFRTSMEGLLIKERISDFSLDLIYGRMAQMCTNLEQIYQIERNNYFDKLCVNTMLLIVLRDFLKHGNKVILLNDTWMSDEETNIFLHKKGLLDLVSYENFEIIKINHNYIEFNEDFFENCDLDKSVYIGKYSPIFGKEKIELEKVDFSYKKANYWDYLYNGAKSNLLLECRNVQNFFSNKNESDATLAEFGTITMGPLVVLFAEWILQFALKNNIKQICPIMRDGYIMNIVLARLCTERNLDIKVIPIYASRKSVFCMEDASAIRDFIKVEKNNNPVMTVGALYTNLGLECTWKDMEDIMLKDAEGIVMKNSHMTVFDIIIQDLETEHIEEVSAFIENKMKMVYGYLNQIINLEQQFISVDFGFAGTIGSRINDILKKYGKRTDHIHLLMCGSARQIKINKSGYTINAFLYNFGYESELFSYSSFVYSIIENCMMGEEGTTLGYNYNHKTETFSPILDKKTTVDMRINQNCHEGILFFLANWINLTETNKYLSAMLLEEKESLVGLLERILLYPTQEEAKALGRIRTDNTYNQNNLCQTIINSEIIESVKKVGDQKYLLIERKNKLGWIAGAAELIFPGRNLYQMGKKKIVDFHYLSMIFLTEKILNDNIHEIAIYGVGMKGHYLKEILDVYGIRVSCYIDRSEEYIGKASRGVPIFQPEVLKLKNISNIAIASIVHQDEIEKDIFEICGDDIKIFKVFMENGI